MALSSPALTGWLHATAKLGPRCLQTNPEPARSLQVLSALVSDARATEELCQRDGP